MKIMRKIKSFVLSTLVLLVIVGCSQDNQVYKEQLEKGKQAMAEENFEVALTAFSKAYSEKPDDLEVNNLLEDAKQKFVEQRTEELLTEQNKQLKLEIKKYVSKTITIHNKFLDIFAISKKTQNDANEMNNLLIEADFTPPKSIYDIHQLYIQFLKHHVKSADLYIRGDIEQSITEMETASGYFSEYKHMFNYFLDENGIQKSEVGWAF